MALNQANPINNLKKNERKKEQKIVFITNENILTGRSL